MLHLVKSQVKEVEICDNHSGNLKCGYGQRLKIKSAEYGRTDKEVCPTSRGRKTTDTTTCSLNVRPLLGKHCDNKYGCRLRSSSSRFGNPCPGVYKYLKVRYECTGKIPSKTISPKSVKKPRSLVLGAFWRFLVKPFSR